MFRSEAKVCRQYRQTQPAVAPTPLFTLPILGIATVRRTVRRLSIFRLQRAGRVRMVRAKIAGCAALPAQTGG